MNISRLRLHWRSVLLLALPLVLGVVLARVKAVRDRAYAPFQHVVVPKSHQRLGQTAAALALSPDSQRLVIADTQAQMWLWSLSKSQFEHHFSQGGWASVQSLAWGKPHQLVVGNSHAVRVFEVPKGVLKREALPDEKKRSVPYQQDPYYQTVVSPHATLAALGQVEGTIAVWDTASGKPHFTLKAPNRHTCGLALSPDDTTVAVASLLLSGAPRFGYKIGIEIALREARSGKLLRILRWDEAEIGNKGGFDGNLGEMGLAFSPDSRTVAGASTSGIALWDVSSGRLLYKVREQSSPRRGGRKWIAFSPDGSILAGVGWGEKIYVWSVRTGQLLQVFHGSPFTVALTFSPDGRFLASGGQDRGGNGVVNVWDVHNLK